MSGKRVGRRAESAAARKEREQREADQQQADLELGRRIRYLRKEILGFVRQQDFADRLGVTRGAVGNWEIGTGVKRTTLQHISEEFNVSLVWLTTGTGAPVAKQSIDAELAKLPPEEYETLYEDIRTLIDNHRRRAEKRKAEAEAKKKLK